jgi:hypothetical protein
VRNLTDTSLAVYDDRDKQYIIIALQDSQSVRIIPLS